MPEAMASALGNLVHDEELRAAFGRAGHERAAAQFGIDRMIQDYEDLYLSLTTPTASAIRGVRPNEA